MSYYLGILIEVLLFLLYTSTLEKRAGVNVLILSLSFFAYLVLRVLSVGKGVEVICVRMFFAFWFLSLIRRVSYKEAAYLAVLFSFVLHIVVAFYSKAPIPGTRENGEITLQWQLVTAATQAGLILVFRHNLGNTDGQYYGWKDVLLLGLSYYLFTTVISQYNGGESFQDRLRVLGICASAVFILLAIVWRNAAATEKKKFQDTEALLHQQYAIWNEKKERDEAIQRMYHDMKQQLSLIQNLDRDTAEQISNTLRTSLDQYTMVPDSGNVILDTILNEKAKECQEHDIEFVLAENIEDIHGLDTIAPSDLCAILGNGIDNAIEGAKTVPDHRRIQVRILQQPVFWVFVIENPYSGERKQHGDQYISTKPDGGSHGFGLPSIQYVVRKYDGEWKITDENQYFSLKVILPL